ncbi:MAG: histidine phosphatase family protein [Actinobacteria bacterium]|nr:histidine phosphatase family protein [Actinomycetota bacterium]
MTLYLVRHAHALSRGDWRGSDEDRPLSSRGHAQAGALSEWMAGRYVDRVLSSRAVRCQQTVAPVAARYGLRVDLAAPLFEGASGRQALELVHREAGADAVLCSHGDVIPALIDALSGAGCSVVGGRSPAKGALYVIDVADGRPVRATYVGLPAGTTSGR